MTVAAGAPDWERAVLGGSGAKLRFARDHVVKRDPRVPLEALAAEAAWHVRLREAAPAALSACFPRVLGMPSAESPELVLERLPGENGRRLALADAAGARGPASAAIAAAFGPLFRLETAGGDGAADGGACGAWCLAHLDAGLERACALRPALRALADAPLLAFPDGVVANPLRDRRLRDAVAGLRPPRRGLVHGDLHLGNLLLDPRTGGFGYVDPRGRFAGDSRLFDPAYDVAKLLHEPQYVAARARAVTTRLEVGGDGCAVEARLAEGARERLEPFAALSRELAGLACRSLGQADYGCAARATLLVGVLFVSLLRFDVLDDGEWEAMLAYGLLWSRAGVDALNANLGPGQCRALWQNLMADVVPSAASTAPLALYSELAAG